VILNCRDCYYTCYVDKLQEHKAFIHSQKPSSDATPAAATSSSSRREPESERASLPGMLCTYEEFVLVTEASTAQAE